MKPSKSLTSIVSQQQQLNGGSNYNHRKKPKPPEQPKNDHLAQQAKQQSGNPAPTSPICRCRVMYLGSSVPHITKDGLQGIQEPLRELYPDKASLNSGNAGIDSWLSVWSNGILIENVDETGCEMKRFFKIEALHYCAAVKYVPQVFATSKNINGNATLPHNLAALPKFLPLDSPYARMQQDTSSNPPIFASILRRTTGVKVLECHAFICKREAAANALVRCCFHAYADTMYAKQIGAELGPTSGKSQAETMATNNNGTSHRRPPQGNQRQLAEPIAANRRSKSIAALNDVSDSDSQQGHQQRDYVDTLCHPDMLLRRKNLSNDQQHQAEVMADGHLQRHSKQFSKSMHQLNQNLVDQSFMNQDSLVSDAQLLPHNPYASRVPSYPPQNIIDQQQQKHLINGGTLRSVKSVAANSIASTLLRSKKHAKAMSMAQLSQQQSHQTLMSSQPISFHQHQQQAANGSFMTMPPVPPMFMTRTSLNGSQTMKLPSRHTLQAVAPLPINFEAMTPKEMKKLLKKSAKYGIDASKFADNGLPLLPLRPIPVHMPMSMPMLGQSHQLQANVFGAPPPLGSDSGTFNPESMFAHQDHQLHHINQPPLPPSLDMVDFSGGGGLSSTMQHLPHMMDPNQHTQQQQPIKSILVKPNPEFLKSKAGKKWLKQQKEFKKLLPAHLDGLPIVFGPPPLDALESAAPPLPPGSTLTGPPPGHPFVVPPPVGGLPILDSNGFYNPHPLYGPSGRASAASTLLRNSPQIISQHHPQNHFLDEQVNYIQRNHHHLQNHQQHQQSMYSNPVPIVGQNNSSIQAPLPPPPPPPPVMPPHQNQSQCPDDNYNDRRAQSGCSADLGRHRRRNHMVEQSVISLGDEDNDDGNEQGDDEETENDYERAYASNNHNHSQRQSQQNGFYNRVETNETIGPYDHVRPGRKGATTNGYYHADDYQDDYEQIAQKPQNEDCNSNSSGIYRRRGHMNERAFSYSIRQEASKSSADNSDAEYRNGDVTESPNYQRNSGNNNNNHIDYHDGAHYDSPQQGNYYQNKSSVQQYYKKQQQQQQHPSLNHHHHHQQQPVDELTSRIENELNMKSFANSCVK